VRHQAGRWLGRLRPLEEEGIGGEELEAVAAELRRLRFGRKETWPEPRGVFRRARRARRAAGSRTRAGG